MNLEQLKTTSIRHFGLLLQNRTNITYNTLWVARCPNLLRPKVVVLKVKNGWSNGCKIYRLDIIVIQLETRYTLVHDDGRLQCNNMTHI